MATRITAMATTIILLLLALALGADAGPSAIGGDIDVPGEVTVQSRPGNDTDVSVAGTFRVTAKNGPDQFLRLTAALSASGGQWPTVVHPSLFEDVAVGTDYEFTISFSVPAGTLNGTHTAYSVTLLLTNVLGSSQIVDSFQVSVRTDIGGGGDDDGGGDPGGISVSDFPWGLLIFIGGLFIFLGLGIVWAYRNLELVREVGGRRRIMMREKSSGRLLKGRYPPSR